MSSRAYKAIFRELIDDTETGAELHPSEGARPIQGQPYRIEEKVRIYGALGWYEFDIHGNVICSGSFVGSLLEADPQWQRIARALMIRRYPMVMITELVEHLSWGGLTARKMEDNFFKLMTKIVDNWERENLVID